jgi:hypothetical protein
MQAYCERCVSRFLLIMLQDIPLHLHKLSENIQVVFLPPNMSLIQSMDQTVIWLLRAVIYGGPSGSLLVRKSNEKANVKEF